MKNNDDTKFENNERPLSIELRMNSMAEKFSEMEEELNEAYAKLQNLTEDNELKKKKIKIFKQKNNTNNKDEDQKQKSQEGAKILLLNNLTTLIKDAFLNDIRETLCIIFKNLKSKRDQSYKYYLNIIILVNPNKEELIATI